MSIQVMAEVWRRSQHSGSALLMLLAIADFADDDGRAYPAVATLAKKVRVKPRAANYTLRELQDSGELDVRLNEGPKGANLYRIALKRLGLQSIAGVQPAAGVQGTAALQRTAGGAAISCSKPLQPVADKPSMNHQEPPGDRKQRLPACQFDALRDLYHQILPELPAVKSMGKKRMEDLSAFWKFILTEPKPSDGQPRAASAAEAIEWARSFFVRARDNDFIMGRTARSAGHENWRASLDYLVTERGRIQVLEKTGAAA